jgi:cell division protein ZapD
VNTTITYEFPLNERIRVFIRLEQLFQQFIHFSAGATAADKRAALSVLLDIIMIFKRNDLKSEVMKELDRDAKILSKIDDNQNADILLELEQMSKKLHAVKGKIGTNVMQSDLFQSIAQRSAIPGGTCSFDLPEYHYWLEQDEAIRLKNLHQWSSPFDDIRIAIHSILNFIRTSNSHSSSQEVALAGFFQIALDKDQSYQMLRVSVDKSIHCFAEISGGKHRCSIRFMNPSIGDVRPVQSTDNIPFTLSCCLF